MASDHHRRSESTATATIIAVVIVLFLLGGLVVVGVGFVFFSRVQMAESTAQMADQQAFAELRQAEALTDSAMVEPMAALAPMRAISIELAEDGAIVVDEKGVDLRELRSMLTEAAKEGTIRLEVTMHVDGRCPFKQVAAVQGACRLAGVTQIHVLPSDDSEQPVPAPPLED